MKKVYFVRHGESLDNVDGIRRGADAELTDTGKRQAHIVAKRFKSIPVDIVLTSHFKRAHDTAVEIANIAGVNIEIVNIARERELPNALIGLHKQSSEARKIVDDIKASWLGKGSLPEGAESFDDLMRRIDFLMDFVYKRPEKNIVIASHSGFGRQLLLRVILQHAVTPEMVLNVSKRVAFSNTGITTYTIDEKGNWILHQWNDDAHLGEL